MVNFEEGDFCFLSHGSTTTDGQLDVGSGESYSTRDASAPSRCDGRNRPIS
jgi:hypothetical protein